MPHALIHADCLDWLRQRETDSVDLVITSPPYEAQRTYSIGFGLKGEAYADWCVERYIECVRVCRGAVCWVIEGYTKNYQWSATPAMLLADLHRRGVRLRKPAVFHRHGIPGSGGPDWLRNDYELIVCASKGKLPWSDNTAMGHIPKWAPGGAMSNRTADGRRINLAKRGPWGDTPHATGMAGRKKNGQHKTRRSYNDKRAAGGKQHTKSTADGIVQQMYLPPKLANPGNVVKCVVGGGQMGSRLAHENEAPFPESLAEFFVRSFCPPGGTVLDCFSGSGTTLAVAQRTGRSSIGIDIRESQIELAQRRLTQGKESALCPDLKSTTVA